MIMCTKRKKIVTVRGIDVDNNSGAIEPTNSAHRRKLDAISLRMLSHQQRRQHARFLSASELSSEISGFEVLNAVQLVRPSPRKLADGNRGNQTITECPAEMCYYFMAEIRGKQGFDVLKTQQFYRQFKHCRLRQSLRRVTWIAAVRTGKPRRKS